MGESSQQLLLALLTSTRLLASTLQDSSGLLQSYLSSEGQEVKKELAILHVKGDKMREEELLATEKRMMKQALESDEH